VGIIKWYAVAVQALKKIATQLRLMKRLWVGKNLGGLLKRRDAEADLVESCIVVWWKAKNKE
jgi:GH24 family phage-related lysozyme (muramidase)